MAESYYDILEISPSASREEIKKAYRRMVRLTHPDAGGDPAMMRRVIEAYDTLSDTNKRYAYDRKLRADAEAQSPSNPQTHQHPDEPRDQTQSGRSQNTRSHGTHQDESSGISDAVLRQPVPQWDARQITLAMTNGRVLRKPFFALGISFLVWIREQWLGLGLIIHNRFDRLQPFRAQDCYVLDADHLQYRGQSSYVANLPGVYEWSSDVDVFPSALARWLVVVPWTKTTLPARFFGRWPYYDRYQVSGVARGYHDADVAIRDLVSS